jgi:hypothetical protein
LTRRSADRNRDLERTALDRRPFAGRTQPNVTAARSRSPKIGDCGADEPPHLAPRRVELAVDIVPSIIHLGELLA